MLTQKDKKFKTTHIFMIILWNENKRKRLENKYNKPSFFFTKLKEYSNNVIKAFKRRMVLHFYKRSNRLKVTD